MSSLKNKTSCGYDGLSNKILKLCGSQFSKPFTYIYNKSLTCGVSPNRLKYAIIKPSNYRPTSLLTGFSTFDLLIFHMLKHHLVSSNILANERLGFCDDSSTESAIFKLVYLIFSVRNNKEYIQGLFCILTKALILLVMNF